MTWSIVAHDPAAGEIGVAVSTCAFAVGSRVPFVAPGVGALATQAFVNPFYGYRGLEMLRAGAAPQDVVAGLTEADAGRADRQLHLMDREGRSAAHTGADCVPWCGHTIRDGFSVAGNMLAGPQVVDATAETFAATSGSLATRFLAALRAGEAAGGDRRGRQSAAMLIHDAEEYALVDLRVDDHADPLAELGRLLEVWGGRFVHYRRVMPSRANPSGVVGRDEIERRIADSMARGRTGS